MISRCARPGAAEKSFQLLKRWVCEMAELLQARSNGRRRAAFCGGGGERRRAVVGFLGHWEHSRNTATAVMNACFTRRPLCALIAERTLRAGR